MNLSHLKFFFFKRLKNFLNEHELWHKLYLHTNSSLNLLHTTQFLKSEELSSYEKLRTGVFTIMNVDMLLLFLFPCSTYCEP